MLSLVCPDGATPNPTNSSFGFFDYLSLYSCGQLSPAVLVLVFSLLLLLLFVMLWTLADRLFVPIFDCIIWLFDVPENIAGVTVTAFGNGAADLFSTYAAFDKKLGRLAFGELVGAGLWVSLVTVAVIAIFYPARLPRFVVNRDLCFYVLTLVLCVVIFADGVIYLWESIVLVLFYGVYVGFAVFKSLQRRRRAITAQVVRPLPVSTSTIPPEPSETGSIQAGDFPSAPPSVASLFGDPDFDEEYYQPTLHFRHSFPSREALHRRTSQTSWHRRSFIDVQQAVRELEPSLSEDALEFHHLESEPLRAVLFRELVLSIPFVLPIFGQWEHLDGNERIWALIQTPFLFVFALSTPVMEKEFLQELQQDAKDYSSLIDVELEPQEPLLGYTSAAPIYPRLLLCVQLFVYPLVSTVLLHAWNTLLFGWLPTWSIALCAGIVLALGAGIATEYYHMAKFAHVLILLGFAQSVLYMMCATEELVNLLEAVGVSLSIPPSILGLTVFALGNSIGELVTNTSIARASSPIIAITACYGGPMLNILLGIGVSSLIQIIKTQSPLQFEPLAVPFWVSFIGLFVGILLSLLVLRGLRYEATPLFGYILLGYSAFVCALSISLGIGLPSF
ncbi:hypothetical protein HDU91_006386 [Kappamyces sp. JEL0680]|nr:hypothetical protein HDU91_006386 [Kappamyces sp. JEL0680]